MKFFIVFLAVVGLACSKFTDEQEEKWNNFKLEHGKLFLSPGKEKNRKETFLANVADVEEHNEKFLNGEVTYLKGTHKHSDLCEEDFLARFTGVQVPAETRTNEEKVVLRGNPPSALDLSTQAGVGPVRDQSSCGSCWTFSTCAALEYAYWRKTGYAGDLAEQQLVDCVYGTSRSGCEGGWMAEAMNYIAKNGGVAWENQYPYAATWGSCKANNIASKSVWLNSGTPFKTFADDDNTVKNALNDYGVLSVCVDATGWGSYQGGIFQSPNCYGTYQCTHAVALVGYGYCSNTQKPYWIIRNSWNTWWGEKGYMRLDATRWNKNILGGLMLSPAAIAPVIY